MISLYCTPIILHIGSDIFYKQDKRIITSKTALSEPCLLEEGEKREALGDAHNSFSYHSLTNAPCYISMSHHSNPVQILEHTLYA
jgi:hypothetical protein